MVHERLHGLAVLASAPLGGGEARRLVVARGSVLEFSGDAVVNAANEGGLGGGGVDGAVNAAGGPVLQRARRALPVLAGGTRIPTGAARVTVGGSLPARWVVHAVGPQYARVAPARGDELLASAYADALARVSEVGGQSVAFSLLSSGAYRGEQPLERVLGVGLRSLVDNAPRFPLISDICMCCFSEDEERVLTRLVAALPRTVDC